MNCRRCKTVRTVRRGGKDITVVNQGRMFVDRVFSENKNYELSCVLCGERKFIAKNTVFGKWIDKKEQMFSNASVRIET